MKDIYRGALVRLASVSSEDMAHSFVSWGRDSEMRRLADEGPLRLWSEKKLKEFYDKDQDKQPPRAYRFSVRALADDKLLGETGLVPNWTHGDAWFYIVLWDREYWGRGHGTDATRLVLQYGFVELNLRRVSLGLHAYNERALKTYEKAGFKMEGRMRGEGLRDGVRFDSLWMGILHEEWLAMPERQ